MMIIAVILYAIGAVATILAIRFDWLDMGIYSCLDTALDLVAIGLMIAVWPIFLILHLLATVDL